MEPILSENNDLFDDEEEEDDDDIIIRQPRDRSKRFYLEIALVLLFFGNNLPSTLLTNQMFKQACLQFNYNATVCDTINQKLDNNSTKDIEKQLQPYVANIQLVISVIHTIIPAILSLFLGPFSDKYGRKPILNSTFTGYALTLTSFAYVCFYSEYVHWLSPWAYAFCYIPATIFGGWPSLLTATLCYITDTTDEAKRPYRLTVIELIIFIGVLLGNLACSMFLSITSTPMVFAISAICAIFSTLIIIFFVEESINAPGDATVCEKVTHLLSPVYLIDMVQTCFKRRSFKERRILWCLISILMLTVFTFNGNATIGYLFERLRFNWTLTDHNNYDSFNIVFTIVGSILGLGILKKWLKFSDMSLICLALISGLLDSSLKAFATYPWQMYLISSVTLFRILSSPMCRTLISTIVPQNEIGKVFAITTSYEALSNLVASPLYTFVYESTFTTFPGAFFLITAAVYIFNICLAFYTMALRKIRESLINPYVSIEEN